MTPQPPPILPTLFVTLSTSLISYMFVTLFLLFNRSMQLAAAPQPRSATSACKLTEELQLQKRTHRYHCKYQPYPLTVPMMIYSLKLINYETPQRTWSLLFAEAAPVSSN